MSAGGDAPKGADLPRGTQARQSAPAQEPIRRVLVFTIIALPLVMAALDSTIVATALHALQHGLHTTIAMAGWTLTGYALGFVVMLPLAGKLSQRHGGRRVFLLSVVVFTLASLLCGLTNNVYVLIACRVLQAVGGAGFTPAATSIVVDHFGAERGRAVSLFGTMFPIGALIGPFLGGVVVTWWSWRVVFFINLPIGILVLALAWRFVPRDGPRPDQEREADLRGMAWMGLSIFAGMLAISALAKAKVDLLSPVFLALLAVSVASGVLFWRHNQRARHPFIPPFLLTGRGFAAMNLVNAVYSGMAIGCIALAPLYATNRYGIAVFDAGTLLITRGLGQIVLSVLAVLALPRTGYRPPLYLGGALIALGAVLLAIKPMGGLSPWAWLATATFIIGCGKGMVTPASRNAGLQLAPEQSASIAAMRSLFIRVGTIAMLAVTTAVLTGKADSGAVQAWIYLVVAGIFFATLPMIARIQEHRGTW